MLRIQKIFDTRNVKRLIKSFQGQVTKANEIIEIYNKLNFYKIVRLLIMLTLFTYFLGCFWYIISSDSYDDTRPETWQSTFEIEQYSLMNRLLVSCYYAITMLSTVGYGDMYPISNVEKIVAVFCMMIGVAVFSVIMEQFSIAKDEYEAQMMDPDNSNELELWLLCLPRFTMKLKYPILNIPQSLKSLIQSDFNYHQMKDRNQYFKDTKLVDMTVLPLKIKSEITCNYLYFDMRKYYRRFFGFCEIEQNIRKSYNVQYMMELLKESRLGNIDQLMFYDITKGLIPRRFLSIDEDMIICDEANEVDEMYFISKGLIGIGFRTLGNMKSNITM